MADKNYADIATGTLLRIMVERLDSIIELLKAPRIQCPDCKTSKPDGEWDRPDNLHYFCSHCCCKFDL